MQVFRGIPERAAQSSVLTIGNFDGVHRGHQALLKMLTDKARSLALPAVVLTFEPHPREYFFPASAPARLASLREKLLLLAGCGVDRTAPGCGSVLRGLRVEGRLRRHGRRFTLRGHDLLLRRFGRRLCRGRRLGRGPLSRRFGRDGRGELVRGRQRGKRALRHRRRSPGRSPLRHTRLTDALCRARLRCRVLGRTRLRLRALCREVDPTLDEAVYVQFRGPHYETPAEVNMARVIGGELVGMSTTLEAIAAREAGSEVLGISLVTNLAAGMTGEPLNHEEVLEAGKASAERMGALLAKVLERI